MIEYAEDWMDMPDPEEDAIQDGILDAVWLIESDKGEDAAELLRSLLPTLNEDEMEIQHYRQRIRQLELDAKKVPKGFVTTEYHDRIVQSAVTRLRGYQKVLSGIIRDVKDVEIYD
jgi:hypothetical protein|tara:strand:- start:153 stop:500 length:348 start_codon:yes stop_codon:yes gene_type:complete